MQVSCRNFWHYHLDYKNIFCHVVKKKSPSLEGHEGMLTKVLFLDVKSLQVNSLDTLDKKKVT